MNYNQAMKELDNENKVKSINWEEGTYLYKGNDGNIFKVIKSQDRELKFSILDLKEEDVKDTWVFHISNLLTRSEHEYLASLINCFKYSVLFIKKEKVNDSYFKLTIKFDLGTSSIWGYNDCSSYKYLSLDFLNEKDKYNGLELDKEYTLKELELTQDVKTSKTSITLC